ncbi:inositol monophosphatase family protein [Paenibacillus gansuensis]|uniref:Inositol monophosphatase family protein n=1 Tax=Paenibacillus gansuensis TaxID=306542 RepID=A0ABW5PBB4_9BACL
MEPILLYAKEVAVEAVLAAGTVQLAKFKEAVFEVNDKDDAGDLVTEVDLLAEKEILERLQYHFPDHQIRSEETGWSGAEGDWLWLVDPLDGTNNYAVGLPLFGVSVTLLYRKEPVLGVIYETVTDRIYTAVRGQGAECNSNPLVQAAPRSSDIRKMTISWIQGHAVQKHPEAFKLKQYIDLHCKRTLRLWAPSLAWCLTAKGTLDGIVLYNSEGDDLYAGVLMVKEAGGIVMDFEGNEFSGMSKEPYLIACHPDHKELMLQLVRNGLAADR